MSDTFLFFQYRNKHFNLTSIKFIETATDCSFVNIYFVDSTLETVYFENESEYGEFISVIRNLKA